MLNELINDTTKGGIPRLDMIRMMMMMMMMMCVMLLLLLLLMMMIVCVCERVISRFHMIM